jgi:hypothetical protein
VRGDHVFFAGTTFSGPVFPFVPRARGPLVLEFTESGRLHEGFGFPELTPAVSVIGLRGDGSLWVAQDGLLRRTRSLRSAQAVRVEGPVAFTPGETLTLAVNAQGQLLAYQWYHNGSPIPGATESTLTLNDAAEEQAGVYSVVVSNPRGRVASHRWHVVAMLTENGVVAVHTLADDRDTEETGRQLRVRNQLVWGGTPDRFSWHVLLPDGWRLHDVGNSGATSVPVGGTESVATWVWQPAAAGGGMQFDYLLTPPSETTGRVEIASVLEVEFAGEQREILADPDPLRVRRGRLHDADANGNLQIELSELLRVIELYNTRYESTRSGRYGQDVSSEDGYAVDSTRGPTDSVALFRYHTADTDRDASLSLSELLRVIELYNTRSGTSRTGAYHFALDTVDGFAPGGME